MEPRECALCGNAYVPKNSHQGYCPTCLSYRKANRLAKRPLGEWSTCPMCGRVCVTETGFCIRCAGSSPDMSRTCPVCGARFSPKNDKAVYCSDRCRGLARRGGTAPPKTADIYLPVNNTREMVG